MCIVDVVFYASGVFCSLKLIIVFIMKFFRKKIEKRVVFCDYLNIFIINDYWRFNSKKKSTHLAYRFNKMVLSIYTFKNTFKNAFKILHWIHDLILKILNFGFLFIFIINVY